MLLSIFLGILAAFFFYCGFLALADKEADIAVKTFLAVLLWGIALALAYAVRAI